MRSYYYGCRGTALVLNWEEMVGFCREYVRKNRVSSTVNATDLFDVENMEDLQNIICDICDEMVEQNEFWAPNGLEKFKLSTISENSNCDGTWFVPFVPLDGTNRVGQDLKHVTVYALWADKDENVRPYGPPAYESYEDLLKEFQRKTGEYLPKDFDWNAHVGDLSYAFFEG